MHTHTQYLLFLIGVLIIVVSFGVIVNMNTSWLAVQQPQEGFEIEQPLLSMNKCGRNIAFPNFSSINLASQRAANDLQITQNISRGTCNTPLNNESSDKGTNTYSVIKDNYIFYSLKRTCIGLKYKSIQIVNRNRISITFNTTSPSENIAFLYFILLNPLFVEFNFSSNKTTVAYYPILHNNISELGSSEPRNSSKEYRYSNYGKEITTRYGTFGANRNPKIYFDVVLSREDKGKDTLFDYYNNDTPYVYLNDIYYPLEGVINMQLYYLDDKIPSSYQNIGKTLSHPQGGNLFDVPYLFPSQNNNDLLIFRTDYVDRYSQNAAYKDVYEFNNNINVFYKNFVQPVFTVSMDILVTDINIRNQVKNNNIVILRMYMDNGLGNYNNIPCNNVTQELGPTRNNNIFMIVLELGEEKHNGYNFTLVMGRGNTCNYTIPFIDKSNVKAPLPFLSDTQRIRVIVTISPNEKIITALWKDPHTFATNVSMSRTTYCGEDLNLYRLFKQVPRQAPIGNIKMNIHNDVVKSVNYVTLGYRNLVNEYSSYI